MPNAKPRIRPRILLWIVAAVAAVAGWRFVLTTGAPPSPPALLPDAASSEAIELSKHRCSVVTLSRRGARWWVLAPFEAPADPTRVDRLLALATLPVLDSFKPREDLKTFGLSPPAATVTLAHTPLDFGSRTADRRGRYVRWDDRVAIVPNRGLDVLDMPSTAFAYRNPLGPDAVVTELRLPSLHLRATPAGWQVLAGKALSPDQKVALVEHWTGAVAVAVTRAPSRPDGPAHRASAADAAATVVVAGRERPIELSIRATGDAVSFTDTDTGLRYHFPAAAARRLLGARPPQPAP